MRRHGRLVNWALSLGLVLAACSGPDGGGATVSEPVADVSSSEDVAGDAEGAVERHDAVVLTDTVVSDASPEQQEVT